MEWDISGDDEVIGERLANSHSFQCESLAGMQVEKFVGFYDGDKPNGISMLALKLKGRELWQRFFLDAGIGFWEEWDEINTFCDWDDIKPVDLVKQYSLFNQPVKLISCKGSFDIFSYIIFEIGDTKLRFGFADTTDIESETILEKI